MKEYEIWSEGFRATGQSGEAHLHAKIKANSFEEAILKHAIEDEDFYKYLSFSPSSTGRGSDYRYWGCRIFDNESDARKAFG